MTLYARCTTSSNSKTKWWRSMYLSRGNASEASGAFGTKQTGASLCTLKKSASKRVTCYAHVSTSTVITIVIMFTTVAIHSQHCAKGTTALSKTWPTSYAKSAFRTSCQLRQFACPCAALSRTTFTATVGFKCHWPNVSAASRAASAK